MDEEAPRRSGDDEGLTVPELAEKIGRNISAALVIGAGFIALAIYARPGPPRFQAFAAGSEIVRVDTRQGTVIACEGGQCFNIHHAGQHVAKDAPPPPALPKPAAQVAPAAPAAPAQQAAPAH
jgi:hypothetical protein